MRPRDSQRSKVYKAEKVLWDSCKSFLTVGDMQQYINACLSTVLVRQKYTNSYTIIVTDGRGRRHACCSGSNTFRKLKMPVWSRKEPILLHELAHALTDKKYSVHGAEFCNNYLFLVHVFMGLNCYNKLISSFKENSIKFSIQRPKETCKSDDSTYRRDPYP